ncbi:hypothetical protein O6P43_028788 [Quillaja saponaria]|uniref:Uncharacterized protein n=1 Tax=Quillaja saponaria TaxID=32244 RepID=A0AAD7KYT5_QUISA|nr:hypothetical protein O6P43_028788 [Quillaja saponaria]
MVTLISSDTNANENSNKTTKCFKKQVAAWLLESEKQHAKRAISKWGPCLGMEGSLADKDKGNLQFMMSK